MSNRIKVYNESGELEEVEVLDFFQLEEYNHEYVLYTKNEEEGDNIVTYVSIVHQISGDEYRFEAITNEEELKRVEEKSEEELDLLMNQ